MLRTVLQCSYFSVVSLLPLKTVNLFRDFLAVLPPPTLYKVETLKKILDTRVQHCVSGGKMFYSNFIAKKIKLRFETHLHKHLSRSHIVCYPAV